MSIPTGRFTGNGRHHPMCVLLVMNNSSCISQKISDLVKCSAEHHNDCFYEYFRAGIIARFIIWVVSDDVMCRRCSMLLNGSRTILGEERCISHYFSFIVRKCENEEEKSLLFSSDHQTGCKQSEECSGNRHRCLGERWCGCCSTV
ncbi:hypothetical protein McpSp1_14700 [Methanocorpusculaceae archaeon Sp1]|nr:hypothetical protein [Methanocorpusculaceae archaeon Sp1]